MAALNVNKPRFNTGQRVIATAAGHSGLVRHILAHTDAEVYIADDGSVWMYIEYRYAIETDGGDVIPTQREGQLIAEAEAKSA